MEKLEYFPGRNDLQYLPGNPAIFPGAQAWYVATGAVHGGAVEYVNAEPVRDVEIRDWDTDETVHVHWADVYATEEGAAAALEARERDVE